MSRYDFVKYDELSTKLSNDYKQRFQELEKQLTLDLGPGQRSFATAMTKLEEAFMWVGKSIRDRQLAREEHAKRKAIREDIPGDTCE